jgi:hypothetical protein
MSGIQIRWLKPTVIDTKSMCVVKDWVKPKVIEKEWVWFNIV